MEQQVLNAQHYALGVHEEVEEFGTFES